MAIITYDKLKPNRYLLHVVWHHLKQEEPRQHHGPNKHKLHLILLPLIFWLSKLKEQTEYNERLYRDEQILNINGGG